MLERIVNCFSMSKESSKHFLKLNLNPKGENTSDCSTRTLCYCLEMEWAEVRTLQEKLSIDLTGRRGQWNNPSVFEPILLSRGWRKILLAKKVPRWKLAEWLRGDIRIYTSSYGHVAPIHKGKVIDTWDSSRGRVSSIIVPQSILKNIMSKLQEKSIEFIVD